MGCWDVFCFACGNTCHSVFRNYIEDIGEMYEEYIESLNKSSRPPKLGSYYKKLFEEISSDPKFFSKLKILYKKSQWLNKNTFLTADDRIIHGCREDSCNIDFIDSRGNLYYHDLYSRIYSYIFDKPNRGIFLHTDCWKYIKSHYKINLKYSDVPTIYEKNQYYKINPKINYGLIQKYWEQDFNFLQVVLDSNEFMCESPLTNKRNQTRIKKILTQLKLNLDPKRTGPAVSATFYPESTIKYGIDGGLWIKSSGKWIKLKEPIEKISVKIDITPFSLKFGTLIFYIKNKFILLN